MDQEEKLYCDNSMNEKQFLQYIRSLLRSKSLQWPCRNKAMQKARIPATNPTGRIKYNYICDICKGNFTGNQIAVDHIIPCGSIPTIESIGEFCTRLYCDTDGMRVLCTNCHDIVTLMQKLNISFEEAKFEKTIIAFKKLKAAEQIKQMKLLKIYHPSYKNEEQRIEIYRQHMKTRVE